MTSNQRFIEETFPVREVSLTSAKEKTNRRGQVSSLHMWWARRPLASSRATTYAALIPAPRNIEKWNKTRQFIIDFSKLENSLNQSMIQKAREDVLNANGGKPPKVLDPFAGGGAIPLEALRLGCETYANDCNPVAILILKCTLEYPQKYGKPQKVKADDWMGVEKTVNPLLEDVNKWGDWVLNEAKNEISRFYLTEADNSTPIGYIWARTIPCQNPTCNAEIPLMGKFWLAKKDTKKVSLFPYVVGKEVKFKIVGMGYEPMPQGFDPEDGTVARAVVTCPVCGGVVDNKTTRQLFQKDKAGQRMVAVVISNRGTIGKRYRVSNDKDLLLYKAAEEYLRETRARLATEWGIDPVPDEPLPLMSGVFNVPIYGINTWGKLFNSRQKLSLVSFADKIRAAHKEMLRCGYDEDYAGVIASYLAICLDNYAEKNNVINRWVNNVEAIAGCFAMQALPIRWEYVEGNPFAGATGWKELLNFKIGALFKWTKFDEEASITVSQCTATALAYPDKFFDAVFTDPPYYFNVPYADLSDFFYVWLKRTIGYIYPDLFSTPLSPKSNEIVEMAHWDHERYPGKDQKWFEQMLTKSFQEIHRVLKPNGIATIVYAHKSTEGWESLVNSLLDSGLIMTGAWPINTELQERLRSHESAALASSIYIVARKTARQTTGFYNEVKESLKQYLDHKLERLWEEGIGGADFFIAAIGSAIEVFGKYEKVMDYEGNIVRADRLLDDVREIATDYAVHQILHDGFVGEITDITRFYVLWRWNYGVAKVPFDEARKLAQSCGIDLANEWNRQRFVKKEKEFIRVLGPQERQLDELKNSAELIDVLHGVLLLWETSNRNEMVKLLQKSGYGKGEVFYRVAQAISETLPIENKEKKLLDGFLAGRERLREEIKKGAEQRRLL